MNSLFGVKYIYLATILLIPRERKLRSSMYYRERPHWVFHEVFSLTWVSCSCQFIIIIIDFWIMAKEKLVSFSPA